MASPSAARPCIGGCPRKVHPKDTAVPDENLYTGNVHHGEPPGSGCCTREEYVMLDPFKKRCLEMAACTPAVRRAIAEEMRSRCVCPACPTYTDCAANNDERLFCDMGYSNLCITYEVDCLCANGCPVHSELAMRHDFYCMRGAEKAQRYEEEVWGIRLSRRSGPPEG